MSNLIIVESQNDKFFIEKLIEVLNIKNLEVGNPICGVHEYEYLNGKDDLEKKLKALKFDEYQKIGIIIDADSEGIEKRVEFISNALKKVCTDIELIHINEFKKSAELDVEIACYIMNIDGKGELETVLKCIKSEDSPYADCLEAWKECLDENKKIVNDKDFDKFWINNYLRFDTCSKKEQKQADKKCFNEVAIKKDIWNFDHKSLDELKIFLKLF